MKKLIFILNICMFLMVIMFHTTSDYCDGWKEGYKQGYCYEVQNCITPIIPICPIAKVNQSSYEDGYNRGFLAGKNNKK